MELLSLWIEKMDLQVSQTAQIHVYRVHFPILNYIKKYSREEENRTIIYKEMSATRCNVSCNL